MFLYRNSVCLRFIRRLVSSALRFTRRHHCPSQDVAGKLSPCVSKPGTKVVSSAYYECVVEGCRLFLVHVPTMFF